MIDQTCETPLVELLERVPEDARAEYEHDPTSHSMIPYGRHCRRAAARIRELEAQLGTLQQRLTDQVGENSRLLDYRRQRR